MSHNTEADLRDELLSMFESYGIDEPEWNHAVLADKVDTFLEKIEANREQAVAEAERAARLDVLKRIRKSYPKKQTQGGQATSRLTLADIDRMIGELSDN